MADYFAPIPRRCRCKTVRVDTTDQADHSLGELTVHGLFHCFAVGSLLRRQPRLGHA